MYNEFQHLHVVDVLTPDAEATTPTKTKRRSSVLNILRLLHSGKVTIHNSEWWQLDYTHDSTEDLIQLIDSYGDVLYTLKDQEIVFINYPTSTCIKLVCIDPHEMDKCHFYLRHISYVTPEHLLLEDLGINSETHL